MAEKLPCAEGKPNAEGELCPYLALEPTTLEGWQAWDITLRCAGQLRVSQTVVIGMDFNAYLKMADALGYSCQSSAELLTACEAGTVAALNEKILNELKNK